MLRAALVFTGVFLMHLVFISVFVVQKAKAVVLPSAERPVYGAEMQVDLATGIYNDVQNVGLSLAQAKGAPEPTSVILTTDGVTYTLPIVEVVEDHCGLLRIVAIGGYPDNQQTVILNDRGVRICGNTPHTTPWDGLIKTVGFAGTEIGELQVSGTPEPMYSIQIEQHYY